MQLSPKRGNQENQIANSRRLVAFYLNGENIDAAKEWKYIADLDMLRGHSNFFAGKFVSGQEWCSLDSTYYNNDEEYTTILKIMRYLSVLELVRPDTQVSQVPDGSIRPEELTRFGLPSEEATAPFNGTESFSHLFNLWLCGNQIRSTSVTRYLMLVIYRRPVVAQQYLSTQVFNEYWWKTNDNEHANLRRMMVHVMMLTPRFKEDYDTRS